MPVGRGVRTPTYLGPDHPSVVQVSLGRQLFVDSFLVDEPLTTMQREFHAGEYVEETNPVLKADRPWEGAGLSKQAISFSGGVFYHDGLVKMWYTCGKIAAGWPCTSPLVPRMANCSVNTCLATSKDGVHFSKPDLNASQSGTNIIRKVSLGYDGAMVWLNHDATNNSRKFLMSEVRGPKFNTFSLLESPDGVHWTQVINNTGEIQDRSTFFYNPFRDVWAFSIKQSQAVGNNGTLSRVRYYRETKDLFTGTDWGAAGLTAWQYADVDDVRLVADFEPQIYNLDVFAYESIMVGQFSILECKKSDHLSCPGAFCSATQNCSHGTQEYNEVFVGFSRDGFSFSRPLPPRIPFAASDAGARVNDQGNRSKWNYQNVQSVAGGVVVFGDWLYAYVSGRGYAAATTSTGLLKLRRDGFASMVSSGTAGEDDTLTTVAIVWSAPLKYLFVNFNGTGLRVAVLVDGKEAPGHGLDASLPFTGDVTRQRLQWHSGGDDRAGEDAKRSAISDLSAFAGKACQLKFVAGAGSTSRLYSFWFAATLCGESGGFLAAGGPGLDGNKVGRAAVNPRVCLTLAL